MIPTKYNRTSWICKGMDVGNTTPCLLGNPHIYDMPYQVAILTGNTTYLDKLDVGDLDTYRRLINAYAVSKPILGTAVLYWKSRFRPQMCTWEHIHKLCWQYTDRDAFYIVSPTQEIDLSSLEPFVEDFKWKEL